MSNRKKLFMLTLIILLVSTLSTVQFAVSQSSSAESAPPPLQWEQYYNSTARRVGDLVRRVIQTRDGGYLMAGVNNRIDYVPPEVILIKTNSAGSQEWIKHFSLGWASGLVQTFDGGFAFAGAANILSQDGFSRYTGAGESVLIKTDESGNMQWSQTFSFTGLGSMVQTIDGGFALAGTSNLKVWFVRADSAGKMLWNRTFEEQFSLNQMIQANDGGYAMVGYNSAYSSTGFSDLMLLKISSSGSLLWTKTYNQDISNWGLNSKSIAQTSDGGYVLTDNVNAPYEPTVIKTDSEGNLLWTQNYSKSNQRRTISSIIETSDGGLAFAGNRMYSESYAEIWVMKTDSSGNTEWNQTFGGIKDSYGYIGDKLIETSDGSIAFAGIWQRTSTIINYYLAKTIPILPLPTPSPSVAPSATFDLTSPSPTENPLGTTQIILLLAVLIIIGLVIGLAFRFKRKR